MKLQLTLRDLFWLVLVCAMGCAWAIREWRLRPAAFWNTRAGALEKMLKTKGYAVEYNERFRMVRIESETEQYRYDDDSIKPSSPIRSNLERRIWSPENGPFALPYMGEDGKLIWPPGSKPPPEASPPILEP